MAGAGVLWDKADVIRDMIKETSRSHIKKIQGDSRGKVNIFGEHSTVTLKKKSV